MALDCKALKFGNKSVCFFVSIAEHHLTDTQTMLQ